MTQFICIRCGADFDRKNKLKSHYYRKNTCKPVNLDIKVDILKEVIDEPNDNVLRVILQATDKDLYCKYLENLLKNSAVENSIIPVSGEENPSGKTVSFQYHSIKEQSIINKFKAKSKSLDCKYCGKTFTSVNNRYRHEKHNCANIYNEPIELDRDEIIEAVLGDETILNDIKKLTQVESKTSNSHNTTVNSNNMVNSNNTNNTTVNINQNAYGQEKFDYIVNDKKIEAYLENLADTNTRKFIIALFKIAFFSPKHPENKTFKLENDKSLVIKILKELPDRWIYASKKETIQKKVEQILGFITDHTTIVTDGSKTDQTIDDITAEVKPAFTMAMKEFETMEILNYRNNKLLEEKNTAKLLNKKIS